MIFSKPQLINVLFVLFTYYGFSQEVNYKKIKNYICLSDNQTKSVLNSKGFELKIPKTWCGYKGFHDILMFSPKSLLNFSKNHYKNNLYVAMYDNPSYNSKNIEEAFRNHYPLLNVKTEFTPVYDESVHEIYGKYYIVKRKSIQEGQNLMNLDLLFNYKNRDYIIHYSVLEKDFNANLNEVIQIMESFKIVE
ncbi:hypothetical protein [Hanstruepera ponticola]|uniref:hypothetical protein n=1 Tax=Hanstruepera ponticola TaxID=2042995 RepID=UPI001782FAD1|nr:hypothetical protein [Hanstruepera ponticola]